MSDLNHITARLWRFLARHGIESRKVAVVLRANDEATRFAIETAIAREIASIGGPVSDRRFDAVQVNGVTVILADLDRSRGMANWPPAPA